jgi:GNAT superfamily N-acetyltransferase
LADVPELVDLFNRISEQMLGIQDHSIEELRSDLQTPGFNLAQDSKVVRSPTDKIVGYQDVFATDPIPFRPDIWGGIDPAHIGLGIGTYLLRWAIDRARHVLDKVPPDVRVSARAWTPAGWQPGTDLLKSQNFSILRHYFDMRIDMVSPPEPPILPRGIEIRPIRFPDEVEDWFRAFDDSFADHFGYVQQPFEQSFEQFKHHALNHPAHDPDLWQVAVEGSEIAGVYLGRKHSDEDPQYGYIHLLGVRRPWRNRGIGLGLLKHAFNEYWQRGQKTVLLIVDSGSLTGAVRLYEKAGMRNFRKITAYELELRPGRDISNQAEM